LINIKNSNLRTIIGVLPPDAQKSINKLRIGEKTPPVTIPESLFDLPLQVKEKASKDLVAFLNTSYNPIIKLLVNTADALGIDTNNKKVEDVIIELKKKVESIPNKNDYHYIFDKLSLTFHNLSRLRKLSREMLSREKVKPTAKTSLNFTI